MSTKIEYNGSIVATVEGGNTATLPVKDKKMATDILVTVPEAEEIVLQEKTVTENGEVVADSGYDGLSKVTVNVPIPQLAAPMLSIAEDTLTIVDMYNGAFAAYYALYINGLLKGNYTSKTIDLATLGLPEGTYSFTAVSKGIYFADSERSNAVSYEVAAAEDALAGTWVFNNTIDFPSLSETVEVYMPFGYDGQVYRALLIESGDSLRYASPGNSFVVYTDGSWISEDYKIVEILVSYEDMTVETTGYTKEEFMTWLQANATKRSSPAIIFTVGETAYIVDEGTTWAEFAASNSNFRYLDSTDGTGMQFNNNGTWQFILYNGEYVQDTDTIIGRAVYTLEEIAIPEDSLAGTWILNNNINAFSVTLGDVFISGSFYGNDGTSNLVLKTFDHFYVSKGGSIVLNVWSNFGYPNCKNVYYSNYCRSRYNFNSSSDGELYIYSNDSNNTLVRTLIISDTYDDLVANNDSTDASAIITWLQANATKIS